MAKHHFKNASVRASFISFTADFTQDELGDFLARLGMTKKRTDDQDREAGFRLVGKSGALRLFEDEGGGYRLVGTATDAASWRQVRALMDHARDVLRDAGGRPAKKPKPPRP